jgi:hypothetical protein
MIYSLYKTIIMSVLMYGSDTWVLTESIIKQLSIFGKKYKENIGIWDHPQKRRIEVTIQYGVISP